VCSQENSPDHTQICPKLRKLFGYDRHQEVVHCLSRICKTQGLHIEYEPAILVRREAQAQAGAEEVDEEDLLDGIARSTRKRPDLAIHLYNETLLVDVSIAHPFAPSYAKKSSEQVIEAREKSKASKYKRATGTIVHPFVLDTFGNRGKCLDQVLKRIKQCAVLDKPKFMKHSRLQCPSPPTEPPPGAPSTAPPGSARTHIVPSHPMGVALVACSTSCSCIYILYRSLYILFVCLFVACVCVL
jgi:hypothetical protein